MRSFSRDADGVPAVFRDILGLSSVDAVAGGASSPCRPPNWPHTLNTRTPTSSTSCATTFRRPELKKKGVEFTREVSDEGFGLMTALRLRGGGELALYKPTHPSPLAPRG